MSGRCNAFQNYVHVQKPEIKGSVIQRKFPTVQLNSRKGSENYILFNPLFVLKTCVPFSPANW